MNYGYIRVSTREQHEDRQRVALLENGVEAEQIFMDKQSGKDFDRPAYQCLVQRPHLHALDGRNPVSRRHKNRKKHCGKRYTFCHVRNAPNQYVKYYQIRFVYLYEAGALIGTLRFSKRQKSVGKRIIPCIQNRFVLV